MASTVQANTITDAAGTGAPSFTNGISASGTSTLVNANFSGNITLPTSGGTAANLNYYEELSQAGSIFTFNGSGSNTVSVTLRIYRTGKVVTIKWPTLNFTISNGNVQLTTNLIPSRFRPAEQRQWIFVQFVVGGVGASASPGMVALDTSGNLQFYEDGQANAFPNAALAIQPGDITYIID